MAHLIYPRGRKDCGIKTERYGPSKIGPYGAKAKVMPAYVQFCLITGFRLLILMRLSVFISITQYRETKIVEMILEAMLRLPQGAQAFLLGNQDILVKSTRPLGARIPYF